MLFWIVFLLSTCFASDLYYEEIFQSNTKSLGLKLSQNLHILGFATSSPAQARGVKSGDILIKVNQIDLQASGPKGLSKLSSLMHSLDWPRTFYFKRIGAGTDDSNSVPPSKSNTNDNNTPDSSSSSTFTASTSSSTTTASTETHRGTSVLRYNAIFPRNERIGIHFNRELNVVGFAHGSDGEIYAAQKLKNVKVNDILVSINHDKSIVQDLLQKRWPGMAAVQYLNNLRPPIILEFSRTIRTKTSRQLKQENMNEANHRHLQSTHLGDHMDIALEGTHHNHDAGNLDHHTTNTYSIMRAEYGPLPTCIRKYVRVVVPFNACGNIKNAKALKGHYAIVLRGGCNFIDKTRAVQAAGAVGLIVINTDPTLIKMPGSQFGMDDMKDITIPSVMIENKAFDIVSQEMQEGEFGGSSSGHHGRSDRWTSRVVLLNGCGAKEITKEEEEEIEEEKERKRLKKASSTYIVGPNGKALYQHHENAKIHHPITGGLMFVDLGAAHPSPPMRLEYLLSSHGKLYQENENENDLYPPLQFASTFDICDLQFVAIHLNKKKTNEKIHRNNENMKNNQNNQNNQKNQKNQNNQNNQNNNDINGNAHIYKHHEILIVTSLPYISDQPSCGIQTIVNNVQNAGYGGVVFLTKSIVLIPVEEEIGVQGAWNFMHGGDGNSQDHIHRPNDIRIPVMTLSVGDGNRIQQAFDVDSTDGRFDIRCTLYPDREVSRVWQQLNVLKDPAQWPYTSDGRRRLMHRMFKLAPKSASRTEAITKCAENAEKYYYLEQQRQQHNEL